MAALQEKLSEKLPNNTAYLPTRDLAPPLPLTLDQKLQILDSKIAKIEELREAGRPEEIRIKNLPSKYGRVGRHPSYPWYGSEVPYEDRLPHLTERLGKYMNPKENELNDWLKLNSDLNNPSFRSFFVQEPSKEPDHDVNFEKGDVLYENPDALQGGSLAKQVGYGSFLYLWFYMMHTLMSGRAVYPIGDEFMDHRAEGAVKNSNWLYSVTQAGSMWHDFDNLAMYMFVAPMFPLMALGYIQMVHMMTDGIVTKIQLNADKDIAFISKVKGTLFRKVAEEPFEVVNLQVLPPAPRSGYEFVNDRQWMTLTDMTTQTNLKVATDPKYWHPKYYQDFSKHIHSLWD